jgi:sulfite exporter TauE/SafE
MDDPTSLSDTIVRRSDGEGGPMTQFLAMFGLGLVSSVHCVAMCGPLVLTYAVRGDQTGGLGKRIAPHVAYQSAKLVSYVLVGLLLGAVGSAFSLGGVRGWVTVFAGAFMIVLGVRMTGLVPPLRILDVRPPRFLRDMVAAGRRRANAEAASGTATLATPLMFGLVTGLLPCGPLQAAQIAAVGTGSAAAGAVSMLGFGLGTAPLMLGFGAVSGYIGERFKRRMFAAAAVLIVVLGLVMLDRGAVIVGSPVTFETIRTAVLGEPGPGAAASFATAADGVVEVPLTIANGGYAPSTVRIPAGRRVRLVVDRREADPCSAQLAVPQLGVLADLRPNAVTRVELPAAKAGDYTLTCGMGMMSGRIEAGITGGGPNLYVLAALGIALVGAGLVSGRRRLRRRALMSARTAAGSDDPRRMDAPAP